MKMLTFEAVIKPLNASATLRLTDGRPVQHRMSAPTLPGTPLGRAPVALIPSPEMLIDDLAEIPIIQMLSRQAAHGGR